MSYQLQIVEQGHKEVIRKGSGFRQIGQVESVTQPGFGQKVFRCPQKLPPFYSHQKRGIFLVSISRAEPKFILRENGVTGSVA